MLAFWILAAFVILFGFVVFRGAPYVPSKKKDLGKAFDELYPLSSDDTLVDIGSGDGVVLRMAAERGAKAIGYELNPALVAFSWCLSRRYPHISIRLADFWRVQLPEETTVVYTFGDARDIAKMAAKVESEALRLKKPLYFISYAFTVPGHEPVKRTAMHTLYRFDALQRQKP